MYSAIVNSKVLQIENQLDHTNIQTADDRFVPPAAKVG